MKIAMIGQKGMPAIHGGVERHVHDLTVRLVQADHEVVVYGRRWYSPGMPEVVDGVVQKYLPSIRTKHLDAISHVFFASWHAIFSRYDVIHYHGVGPALLSWLPRLFGGRVKVVTTFHSIDRYHSKWNGLARLFLRLGERCACWFAHQTITVSESLSRYCWNEFQQNTMFIPNGVNITPVPTIALLKNFGLNPGKYVVMVSRLVPHKGTHLLVEAFANLKRHYGDDPRIGELKLAVVGGSAYTDEYIRDLHLKAGFCNDIVFTDFQSGDSLSALYAHAQALIHPSLSEGLPITVLQAMSYDRPVLVSNIPEHLELIDDPRMVFVQGDVEAIEEKLIQFVRLPVTERELIGQHNGERIRASYSWDNLISKVCGVYESVASRRKIKAKEKRTAVST